jgi:hypothetical protein
MISENIKPFAPKGGLGYAGFGTGKKNLMPRSKPTPEENKTTTASGSDGNISPGKQFGVREGNLEALVGGSTDRAQATQKLTSKKKKLIVREAIKKSRIKTEGRK